MNTVRTDIDLNGVLLKISIYRSERKSIAARLDREGCLCVRAPLCLSDAVVKAWILSHEKQIKNLLARQKAEKSAPVPFPNTPLSRQEIIKLTEDAREAFADRVAYFAPIVGVAVERITVRHQRTRFGSCSAKGNVNLNCLLLLCPPDVMDYVIVHELCHRRHFNHSAAFWAEVKRVLPDYQARKEWLSRYGGALIDRLSRSCALCAES